MRGDFCVFIPFLLAQSKRFSFEIWYCPKKEVTLNRIGIIRLNIAKDVHEAKSGQIKVSYVLYSINDKKKKHKRRQLDSIRQVAIPSMLLYNITKITTTPQTTKRFAEFFFTRVLFAPRTYTHRCSRATLRGCGWCGRGKLLAVEVVTS